MKNRYWIIGSLALAVISSVAFAQIFPPKFKKSKDLEECVQRVVITDIFGDSDKRVVEEFQKWYNRISKTQLEITKRLDENTYSAVQEVREAYFSEEFLEESR